MLLSPAPVVATVKPLRMVQDDGLDYTITVSVRDARRLDRLMPDVLVLDVAEGLVPGLEPGIYSADVYDADFEFKSEAYITLT